MGNQEQLDVELINPFFSSISKNFSTMLQMEAKRMKLFRKNRANTVMSGDVSGLINFFGDVTGSVVVSFPRKTAVGLCRKFMMDESITDISYELFDATGELANLICGVAKSGFETQAGLSAEMSVPTIVAGRGHHILHKGQAPILCVVYNTDVGLFVLELCLEKMIK